MKINIEDNSKIKYIALILTSIIFAFIFFTYGILGFILSIVPFSVALYLLIISNKDIPKLKELNKKILNNKRTISDLEKNEKMLNKIINFSSSYIFIINNKNEIVLLDVKSQNIFFKENKEFFKKNIEFVIEKNDMELFKKALERSKKFGKGFVSKINLKSEKAKFISNLIINKEKIENETFYLLRLTDLNEVKEEYKNLNHTQNNKDEDKPIVFRVNSDGLIGYANKNGIDFLDQLNLKVGSSLNEELLIVLKDVLGSNKGLEIDYEFKSNMIHIDVLPNKEGAYVDFYGSGSVENKIIKDKLKIIGKTFESTREGIIIADKERKIIDVNPAFSKITGYELKEIIGKDSNFMANRELNKNKYEEIKKAVEKGEIWEGELWNFRKNKEIFPARIKIEIVKNEENEIENYIVVFTDVSKDKEKEKEIEKLFYYDRITGLPNKNLFYDRLNQALIQAKRNKHILALVHIRVNDLVRVNDSYGFNVSEEYLSSISKKITEKLRESDTVAFLGGEKFGIVLNNIINIEDVILVLNKIKKIFDSSFKIKNKKDGELENEVYITSSLGVTIFPGDSDDFNSLRKNADIALHSIKNINETVYKFFNEEMNVEAFERLEIEMHLRKGLQNNEFELLYQPKIDTNTRKIVGMESLIRWNSEALGYVMPFKFIPIAEETTFIIPLGEWIIKQACNQLKIWEEKGLKDVIISVNLSPIQLRQRDLPLKIKEIIKETNIDPKSLEFELTESVLIENMDRNLKFLKELKDMGIRLSIDDFGTGYSSLSYLKKFPVDVIKIDRIFVKDISTNEQDSAIVKTIINLAHNLKMKVVAEGVETSDQLRFLKDNLCDEIQGYYFSKPLNSVKFFEFYQKNK